MNIFTLMAFAIPEGNLTSTQRSAIVYTFLNASGAIQPVFLSYWNGAYQPVLYSFGSIHLILSIWMVLDYFVVNWPYFKLPSVITRYND